MALQRQNTLWTVVFLLCSWLVSQSVVDAAVDLQFVIEGTIISDNSICKEYLREQLKIGCAYRGQVDASNIIITTEDPPQTLYLTPESSWTFALFDGGKSYTIPVNDATGTRSYECTDGTFTASITIQFASDSGCSGTTASPTTSTDTSSTPDPTDPTGPTGSSTGPTGSSTDSTGSTTDPFISSSTDSTTDNAGTSSNSGGTTFKGLKPLIYTVASVILLGTLAIVAIITCWIRARRSFHSRVIRPNNTPQDYLDYISDNEFTPLTTSEFLASLQERPPTYNQSEEMTQETDPQQTARTGETTTSSSSGATAASSGERREASLTQPGGQPSSAATNEGAAVVERRRSRVGSADRERQRRRRRVVIVESGDSRPQESSVTVTSTQGGVVVTYEEEGGATSPPRPSRQSPAPAESDENKTSSRRVTVRQLVPLELPVSDHTPNPSQREIGAIEARVNMVESLSPPPISEHHTSMPPVTSDEVQECGRDNLIDFSAPPLPPPSTFYLPSDL